MPGRLGSPNKNKKFLLNRLQDMYVDDLHPIMKMSEDAISWNDTIDDLKRSIDAWDRIAKYTEPKLKAVNCCYEEGFLVNVQAKPLDP